MKFSGCYHLFVAAIMLLTPIGSLALPAVGNGSCSIIKKCDSEDYCFKGKCYDGSLGDPCGVHQDCQSNICSVALGSICADVDEGDSCTFQGDCKV